MMLSPLGWAALGDYEATKILSKPSHPSSSSHASRVSYFRARAPPSLASSLLQRLSAPPHSLKPAIALNPLHPAYVHDGTAAFPTSIDWSSHPACLDPVNFLPERRAFRKRAQVENCLALAGKLMENISSNPNSPIRITEFCCGSGIVGLNLAYLLGLSVSVDLVERSAAAVKVAEERKENLQLNNVRVFHCGLQEYRESFDFGIGLHACGSLSDLILLKCWRISAAFLIVPCCTGKLRYGEGHSDQENSDSALSCMKNSTISENSPIPDSSLSPPLVLHYPLSEKFRSLLTKEEYFDFSARSDPASFGPESELSHRAAEYIVFDRQLAAQDRGYSAEIHRLEPPSCTVKNLSLSGWKISSPSSSSAAI